MWDVPLKQISERIDRQSDQPPDSSQVGSDTIFLTAAFTDGQTVEKQVSLSFDKNGMLLAKMLP